MKRLGTMLALCASLVACGSPPDNGSDAAPTDAAFVDASVVDGPGGDAHRADAATIDAGAPDARPPGGPGEVCGTPPNWCEPALDCWVLLESGAPICTKSCVDAADCTAAGYGVNPCCAAPGTQTLETVCIPRADPACVDQ